MAQSVTDGPLHDLTGFQRDILRVLEILDEPKGLAVMRKLQELYDGKEINHGRVYPNLDQLAEKGLVEKGEKDNRTNSYVLTPRGRRELDSHRAWLARDRDE